MLGLLELEVLGVLDGPEDLIGDEVITCVSDQVPNHDHVVLHLMRRFRR